MIQTPAPLSNMQVELLKLYSAGIADEHLEELKSSYLLRHVQKLIKFGMKKNILMRLLTLWYINMINRDLRIVIDTNG